MKVKYDLRLNIKIIKSSLEYTNKNIYQTLKI